MKRAGNSYKQKAVPRISNTLVLLLLLIMLIISVVVHGSISKNSNSSKTIAIVNGKKLSEEQLYELLLDSSGKQALERLITSELIDQEADKKRLTITEADIDMQLDLIKREYDSPEEYRNKLAEDGFTDRTMRAQIKQQLLLRGLLADKTSVTEDDIAHYFEQNKAIWQEQAAARVTHILVASKERAEELLIEINNGANFTQLARKQSIDIGASSNGGDLGFIEPGYLEKGFEDAVFSMQPGSQPKIIETSQGFHIVQVTERREGSLPSYSQRKEQLKNELIDANIYDLIDPWLKQLRAEAVIELKQMQ